MSAHDETLGAPDVVAVHRRDIVPGSTVGRYVIIERVGSGTMGTVYVAHDPRLDRQIAIKVLHERAGDERRRGTQLREGKALARLSDPHVVAVFDVGLHEQRVFVAMEYVRGATLRAWCEGRSVAEIVRIYCDAARGLAAAHAAGIVHGDFKPDNVLVGADGRAKVGDFGLARGSDLEMTDPDGVSTDEPNDTLGTGWLGTPAYAAAERFTGLPASMASDQFAFCVSLWEALVHARPFTGGSLPALAAAVLTGPPPWPRNVWAPRVVRDAIVRGLASDPAARHAGMNVLVDLLASSLRPRRRSRWLALAALGGLAILGAAAATAVESPVCRPRNPPWTRADAEAVTAAFAVRGAREDALAIDAALERWSDAWSEARAAACADGIDRDLVACLDRYASEVDVLVEHLRMAEPALLEAADRVPQRLPELRDCRAAHDPTTGDPQRRETIDAIRAELAAARGLVASERFDDAARMLEELHERARVVDDPVVTAEVEYSRGDVASERHDGELARAALQEAAAAATQIGDRRLAARVWNALVYVNAMLLHDSEAAHVAARHVEAELASIGGDERIEARFAISMGVMQYDDGELERARQSFERAVALHAALGDDRGRIDALHDLAGVEHTLRDNEAAVVHLQEAMAISDERRDDGSIAYLLGMVEVDREHATEAEAAFRHSLRQRERILGKDHGDTLRVREKLIMMRSDRDLPGALAEQRELVTLTRTLIGPRDASTARSVLQLAELEQRAGELDDAERDTIEALAILEEAMGADHPAVSDPLELLARVRLAQDEPAAAVEPLVRALAIVEAAWGAGHAFSVVDGVALAEARRRAGDPRAAIVDARTAVARAQPLDQPELLLGARLELARSLHAAGEHAEANALAAELLPALDAAGDRDAAQELRSYRRR